MSSHSDVKSYSFETEAIHAGNENDIVLFIYLFPSTKINSFDVHLGQDPEKWDSRCVVPPLVTQIIKFIYFNSISAF
jgi:hypothetical protein